MNQNMLMSVCFWAILGGAWAQVTVSEGDLPQGGTDYNHLPVRSAAAIILDRVLGCG